jgi:translation initiation factor IF-2
MADVTVKQLAQVVGIPVERLLNQLQEAGLSFTDDQQTVNEEQKRILLNHLKGSSVQNVTTSPEQITLRRKSLSQVTVGHDSHSAKTVNVEVRKKKFFVKRPSIIEEPEVQELVVTPETLSIEEHATTTTDKNDLNITEISLEAKDINQEPSPDDSQAPEDIIELVVEETIESLASVPTDPLEIIPALEEVAQVSNTNAGTR